MDMKPAMIAKVLACIVPGVLFGGLAYWFYLQPARDLQAERETVLERAVSLLEDNLWDPVSRFYREVPVFTGSSLAGNHYLDDKFLA